MRHSSLTKHTIPVRLTAYGFYSSPPQARLLRILTALDLLDVRLVSIAFAIFSH